MNLLDSLRGGHVAGIDEAGRGPLAGPVVAAAVILDEGRPISGLADSKKLSEQQRDRLALEIVANATSCGIGWADPAEIDVLNILNATLLAMRRALLGLTIRPGFVQVDGNRLPDLRFHDGAIAGEAIVGGDDRVASISAASIIAKTSRDRMMAELHHRHPQYGFPAHKGYGTRSHREEIARHGPCCHHRFSFRPIKTEPPSYSRYAGLEERDSAANRLSA